MRTTSGAALEERAARDVIARARHVKILRDTTTAEIVSSVAAAIAAGECVRLGRLALQAWVGQPIVRYVTSDEDDARNDPERWATTARVRKTLTMIGGAESMEIAGAFVKAWMRDWGHGAAPLLGEER